MIQEARLAVDGLKDHRVRTFLTTLGVVFGVAAVISMLSISEGAKAEALSQFESMGIDNIVVMHQDPPQTNAGDESASQSRGLSRADARAIARVSEAVRMVVPMTVDESTVQGVQQPQLSVVGTTPDWAEVKRTRLLDGRFFTRQELDEAARVAVIGSGVVRELCGLQPAVGSFIKITGVWYEIIGVFAGGQVGEDDAGGLLRSTDRDVCIPLTCALARGQKMRWDRELDRMMIQVADLELLAPPRWCATCCCGAI